MNAPIKLFYLLLIAFSSLILTNPLYGQDNRSRVYDARYKPIYLGFEAGSGLTVWQNATPTFFATVYPFANPRDTIHVRFNSGVTPLFGFYGALRGDFYLDPHWSVLAKFGYAELRGNWESTEPVPFDTNGVIGTVPVASELTFMARTIFLDGMLKYRLDDAGLYFAGGLALTAIASNHYDLTQTIEGDPADLSFRNFTTGQGSSVRDYGIGGEQPLTNAVLDLKLLAGIPVLTLGRWSLLTEAMFGAPLLNIWTTNRQNEYESAGLGSGPMPVTITGILALRYHYH
jgi:hypothetical protein